MYGQRDDTALYFLIGLVAFILMGALLWVVTDTTQQDCKDFCATGNDVCHEDSKNTPKQCFQENTSCLEGCRPRAYGYGGR